MGSLEPAGQPLCEVRPLRLGGCNPLARQYSSGSKLEIVLSGKAGAITGTLRNEKDEPLGGVTVTAWPKNFAPGSPLSSVKSRSSGTDGKFSIPSLAPGDYYVAAWEGEGMAFGLHHNSGFPFVFHRRCRKSDARRRREATGASETHFEGEDRRRGSQASVTGRAA